MPVFPSDSAVSLQRLLLTESLVIGVGRRHHKLLGARVKNRLLRVACSIGQTGHLHLQRHCIFGLTHVRVDAQGKDLLYRTVKHKRHAIAGLGKVRED